MLDPLTLDLLLLAVSDDRCRRRLISRLRPRVVGWSYPRDAAGYERGRS